MKKACKLVAMIEGKSKTHAIFAYRLIFRSIEEINLNMVA